jgi:hypothetical protein
MWSAGVTEEEATQAVLAIQEIINAIFRSDHGRRLWLRMPEIRPFGTWEIPSVPRGAAYWGTQWYVERSLDVQQQRIRARDFLRLVEIEPWQLQAPHFDMALLDYDLMLDAEDDPETLTLALTLPGTATVLSVAPLRGLRQEDQMLAWRRLVAHQLGHLVRAPRLDRVAAVDLTQSEPHCQAVCAMRHADNTYDLLRHAHEEAAAGITYCPACQRDLRIQLASIQFSRN